MTDEQIKQNAEAYADVFGRHMVDYYGEKDAFIAGAHSRDEEIKELEWEKKHYQDIAWQLAAENEQLRNPWVSVEDGLPEKIKNKGVSKYVFVTWPDGTRGEAYYNYEEYKAPRWEIKGAGVPSPVAWMPIPQLKKRE